MARLWRIELIYADDGIAMIYTVQFLPSRKAKVTIIVIFECRFGFSNPELGGKHTIDVYFCLDRRAWHWLRHFRRILL